MKHQRVVNLLQSKGLHQVIDTSRPLKRVLSIDCGFKQMGIAALHQPYTGPIQCKFCRIDTINDSGIQQTLIRRIVEWWRGFDVPNNYDAVVIEQQHQQNRKMLKLAGWLMVLCENDRVPLHIVKAWEKHGFPGEKKYGAKNKQYKVDTLHACIDMIDSNQLVFDPELEWNQRLQWLDQKAVNSYNNTNGYFDKADSLMQGVYFINNSR